MMTADLQDLNLLSTMVKERSAFSPNPLLCSHSVAS